METGIATNALMAGFATGFIAAFVVALPYVAWVVFRRLIEP